MDSSGASGKSLLPFPESSGMDSGSSTHECVCCLWCSLEREPKLCVESPAQGSREAKDVGCVSILGDPGSRTAIP